MDLSWEIIYKLEQEYGDSFYILDLNGFEQNYKEFLGAFRNIYPNSKLAYSYKTNYIPKLCRCVNNLGGYAEVVSQMEYDLALRAGVSAGKIIFNGPFKSQADIEKALLAGSIVNLDSSYEVPIVQTIAQKWPERIFNVGIRCNFDIGTEYVSRFGFDVEGDEFRSALAAIKGLKNCRVSGLHCHVSTPQRSVASYALRAKKILEIYDKYFSKDYPRFIDLGGGFFGKMPLWLKDQFPFHIPNYKDYAEAIAVKFAARFPGNDGPQLILEPGIAVVADVMKFITKVIDIKTIRSKKFALVSGSVHNVKPTLNNKNLPMQVLWQNPAQKPKRTTREIDIVGYTCMENDCLYRGYNGPLDKGDYLVFKNVGAYTIVLKPPFIKPSPAIISYDANSDKFETVKRREQLNDVFSTYIF